MMRRFVLLVVTLLCIYVTFSYAKETKETTITVTHLESQPLFQVRCPDGRFCPAGNKCCPYTLEPGRYGCCRYGPGATCCPDYLGCCPAGFECDIVARRCFRSSLLGNNTEKLGRDGTAGIYIWIIPSKQVETSLKRIGFLHTSDNVLSPDEKYQCPDGTSPCELVYGTYGCCPIQNKREIKLMDSAPEDADPDAQDRGP